MQIVTFRSGGSAHTHAAFSPRWQVLGKQRNRCGTTVCTVQKGNSHTPARPPFLNVKLLPTNRSLRSFSSGLPVTPDNITAAICSMSSPGSNCATVKFASGYFHDFPETFQKVIPMKWHTSVVRHYGLLCDSWLFKKPDLQRQ